MPTNPAGSQSLGRALLPLRFFLGITFVYAGLDKFLDPAFLQASGPGSIGEQLTTFEGNSPVGFLVHLTADPFPVAVGVLIALAEIAAGLGTITGLLFRASATVGFALSAMFYLTASWTTVPYYYGPDLPYAFAWLTVALVGHGGVLALDERLARAAAAEPAHHRGEGGRAGNRPAADRRGSGHRDPDRQKRNRQAPGWVALDRPAADRHGWERLSGVPPEAEHAAWGRVDAARVTAPGLDLDRHVGRRDFLRVGILGAASLALGGFAAVWPSSRPVSAASQARDALAAPSSTTAGLPAPSSPSPAITADATASPTTPAPTTATATAVAIGSLAAVQSKGSSTFRSPTTGDPGVLVALPGGTVGCFDAICTHAGCTVAYDSASKLLRCPCHGATFDPTRMAAVVRGPARTALANLPIRIDSATGKIYLAG